MSGLYERTIVFIDRNAVKQLRSRWTRKGLSSMPLKCNGDRFDDKRVGDLLFETDDYGGKSP